MTFNLADLFESVVDVASGQEAMVSSKRRLTYRQLDERANALAHALQGAGVGRDERVGLQLTNGTEYIEAMLACFKIRAIPVNVNFRYVASELRYLYRDAGLVGLIFHESFAAAVAEAASDMEERRIVLRVTEDDGPGAAPRPSLGGSDVVSDYEETVMASLVQRPTLDRSSDDLYCVYTGGTTGMPKGVLWRHEDIFFAAMGGGDPLSLGDVITEPEELPSRVLHPGMTSLAVPPFMHASGHWLAFSTLFGGGKVVTLPGGRFDASTVWDLVEQEAVNTVVIAGDAMARPLLDELEANQAHRDGDLSSLLAIGSGGAVLSPGTKRRLAEALPGRVIVDAFGSSETGQVGGEAPEDDPFGAPRLRVDEHTNVLDDRLQPVMPGSGRTGMLARSGHIPIGYLGDEEKTARTFVSAGRQRWALPGDMATVEVDGTISVLGRGTLSINTGGEKVFPDEVEAVVKGHPDIADAVIVGLPDERFGERVVAVVQTMDGSAIDVQHLRDFCRPLLTGYKIPRQVIVTRDFVRSPSGKPDYRWARQVAAARPPEERLG